MPARWWLLGILPLGRQLFPAHKEMVGPCGWLCWACEPSSVRMGFRSAAGWRCSLTRSNAYYGLGKFARSRSASESNSPRKTATGYSAHHPPISSAPSQEEYGPQAGG